jgi:GTP-binding protein EngB required for normal cell division
VSPLNPHQTRHIVSTFTYVDSLLQSVERVARGDLSPFAKEQPDIARDEARLLQSFLELVRSRMLAALDRLGIPRPEHKLSARWSAETALNFAETSLTDLDGEHLKGYGSVDETVATELAALAADVRGVLRRARHVFHERDPGGLAETLGTVTGPVGEVLREIDRLSRERALAEVRPLLVAATERAIGGTFDVGVFGRVSAGKSSLINALVGESVLPVGATPVTAVPTRLTQGARAAVVHFIDGDHRPIAVDDIAEYATEARNPENRAGVRAIEVTVPTVPQGLRLLDTPGVGSLGTSGPALAFKWLPRCDLGLVLIAAGGAIGRDDLALVAGLHQAGIRCVVLLSKADLVPADQIEPAVAYVQREVAGALGADVATEVHPISTAPHALAWLAEFRGDVLAPLARDHAHAAQRALVERLRRLIRVTAAAMSGRQGAGAGDGVVRLQRARAGAMDRLRREVDRIDDARAVILEAAATAVSAAWQQGEDAGGAARSAIVRAAVDALGAATGAIDAVRELAGATGMETRRLPPLFDPEFLDEMPPLPPPPVARRLIGHAMAARRLEPIGKPLGEALQRYASRLYAWGTGVLEELGSASWDAADPGSVRALPPDLERLDRLLDDEVPAARS